MSLIKFNFRTKKTKKNKVIGPILKNFCYFITPKRMVRMKISSFIKGMSKMKISNLVSFDYIIKERRHAQVKKEELVIKS